MRIVSWEVLVVVGFFFFGIVFYLGEIVINFLGFRLIVFRNEGGVRKSFFFWVISCFVCF